MPYFPWSLLAMRPPILALCTLFLCFYFVLARKGFVWINQCMFQLLGSFLHLLAVFIRPMISCTLGSTLSCEVPIYVAVWHVGWFLPDFSGLFLSLSLKFLTHKSHPSSWIGFHLFLGCQYFLAIYCHVIPQSVICPDLRAHSFLEFACHTFYLLFPFLDFPIYFSYLVLKKGVVHVSLFFYSSYQTFPCLLICTFVSITPLLPLFYAIF